MEEIEELKEKIRNKDILIGKIQEENKALKEENKELYKMYAPLRDKQLTEDFNKKEGK